MYLTGFKICFDKVSQRNKYSELKFIIVLCPFKIILDFSVLLIYLRSFYAKVKLLIYGVDKN